MKELWLGLMGTLNLFASLLSCYNLIVFDMPLIRQIISVIIVLVCGFFAVGTFISLFYMEKNND